ncbi:mycothiol synthase [Nocardioides gansuensis]|uniref:Mycothiol acetyltransferase n=1 Tax=Nocardioides gansuensis TaxID=2138300 RepID=A0A2T8FFG4_9ACTN|nr:mycothiol synthase [Nocardioides gansuensis]PVG84461.1 mycothiol synthase [Nocardioides gansuensis]
MLDLDRIAAVAEAAALADGAEPLDEATWLALRSPFGHDVAGEQGAEGFWLVVDEALSLVVHPRARGRGLGGELLRKALEQHTVLTAWSHADHPAAARLAAAHGFRRVRELWLMRRALTEPLLPVPAGVEIRSYRDSDRDELLRVNAAAFAHHPEQGALDAEGLALRMAEPWWDPAGLLVVPERDRLLGFHWTKQHSPGLGEVYVLGIAPEAQGRGLGRALTLAGLHHLTGLGVGEVVLYVEGDNAAAIRTYSGLGFSHAPSDTHVMYSRDAPAPTG